MARLRLEIVAALAAVAFGARPALAAAPPPPELPARLDLDRALELARTRGLDVLTAEAAVEGAQGDLRAAGAIANPTLSGTYGRSIQWGGCVDASGAPTSCPSLPAAVGVGLADNAAVSDTLNGKRGLREDVARAALAAARLQRDDALRALEAQVKSAFVQVVAARATLAFSLEVAKAQARTVELSRARVEAGAISEADLARIETARLEADQAADSARGQLRAAQVSLAFLLGVRGLVPEFDVDPGPFERSGSPERLAAATRDALVARALATRPDVLAARRLRERADAALALARRQRVPDVTLSVAYAQQGTGGSAVTPPTWTAGVSLPLPLFYRQQGEIRRAEADLRAQDLSVARAEATATSDVESAWAAYVAARALVARMEGSLLERARTARELVEIQYRKGAATLLDLLDAERTWIGTRVEYLQDLAGYWTAVFRLEQAAGEELR